MEKIKQQFLLNLKFKPSLIVYINLRNDSLAEHFDSIIQMNTTMIQNSIIYTKELELFKDYDYSYYYMIKENGDLTNEICRRNFRYDSETQFKPDEWNKTWVLYRVTYKELAFQDCIVEIIANGHSLKLQPKNETKQLEASEMITNVEEFRQFQISLKDQNIKRMGKKINVANYKKCKMNSIIVPFSVNCLHVDNAENPLNTLIEQNFDIFQTQIDQEKEKDQQNKLEIKKKEKQINYLMGKLMVLENECQQKDKELTNVKNQYEQLHQGNLEEQKYYYENRINELKQKHDELVNQGNSKCDQIYTQYMKLKQTLNFKPLQDSLSSDILDQNILKKIKQCSDKVIDFNTEEQTVMVMENGEEKNQKLVELTTKSKHLYEEVQDILSQIKEYSAKPYIADSQEEAAEYRLKIKNLQIKEDCYKTQIADSQEEAAEYRLKIKNFLIKEDGYKNQIADSQEEAAEYSLKIKNLQQLCETEIQKSRDLQEYSNSMNEKLKNQIEQNKIQQQNYKTEIVQLTQAHLSIKKKIEDAQQNIFEPFFKNQFEYQQQISIRYQNIAKQQITEQLYELQTATNQAIFAGMQLSNGYELYKTRLIPLQHEILQQINEINATFSLSNIFTLFQNVKNLSNLIGLIEDLENNEAQQDMQNQDFDLIQNLRQQRANMDRKLWSLEKLKEVLQEEQNISKHLQCKAKIITQLYLNLTKDVNEKLMLAIEEVKNKK